MAEVLQRYIRRKWEICKRDDTNSRWATLYATLNHSGDVVISRVTHEAMGSPEAVFLMFDRETQTIGLKPAHPKQRNAYRVAPRGNYGGQRVRANRLCRDNGIHVPNTVIFPRSHIDRDGVLILDLRDTRPIQKHLRADGY